MIIIFLLSLVISAAAHEQLIEPGIVHKKVILQGPIVIHVIDVDPTKVTMMLESASGICASAEKTSSMAKRTQATVAINGGSFDFGYANKALDFLCKVKDALGFQTYDAFPTLNRKINSVWHSTHPHSSGTVSFNRGGVGAIGLADAYVCLIIDNQRCPVASFNRPYGLPALYNRAFSAKTPACKNVTEIIVDGGRITARVDGNGNTNIPTQGFVYALQRDAVNDFKVGQLVCLEIKSKSASPLLDYDFIVSSTPMLLQNGIINVEIYEKKSQFYTRKHPRTAVGILPNNHWLFVVVDGRQNRSLGFSLLELAQFMKDQGCVDALNLGGGGDTTLVIKDKVINFPSGRRYGLCLQANKERAISDAIIIKAK